MIQMPHAFWNMVGGLYFLKIWQNNAPPLPMSLKDSLDFKIKLLNAIHLIILYTVPDKSLVAWVQIDLKCPSNIFRINIFFYKKWLILIPTAFGIMFWYKTKLLKSILTLTAW